MGDELFSLIARLVLDATEYYSGLSDAAEGAEHAKGKIEDLNGSAGDTSGSLREIGSAADDTAGGLDGLSGSIGDIEGDFDGLMSTTDDTAGSINGLGGDASTAESGVDGLGGAASDAAGTVGDLGTAASDASGSVNGLGSESESSSSKFSGLGSSAEAVKGKLEDLLTKVGGVTGMVEAWKQVNQLIADVASTGDDIDKTSQKLGLSAEAYQEWDFILQHNGTGISTLKTAMRTLRTNVNNADTALSDLGITYDDLKGKTEEEIFSLVVEKLQAIEDPAQKAALATELFGTKATELMPLLNSTAEDTEALKKKVHELNGVMSEETVKAAAAYCDAQQNVQVATQGIKTAFAQVFLESDTAAMEAWAMILAGIADTVVTIAEAGASAASDMYGGDVDLYIAQQKEAAEATDSTTGSMGEQEVELDALALKYIETYNSIRETVAGFTDGFDQKTEENSATIDDMITGLNSQADWYNYYAENMETILNSGMGLEDLAAKIGDMGADGAIYAQALAEAVNAGDAEKVEELKTSFDNVTTAQDGLASALAQTSSAFDDLASQACGDLQLVQDKLNELDNRHITVYFDGKNNNMPDGYGFGQSGGQLYPEAGGIDYVPYHNFNALLHEGEMVLTKEDASAYRKGSSTGGGVTIVQNISAVQMSPVEVAATSRAYFESARWAV